MAQAQVVQKPQDVAAELRRLGLVPDDLRRAVIEGQIARDSCTVNDPAFFAGILAWAKTVRALREVLVPMGWEKNDDGNFATIRNPDRELAIAVMTGDDLTGCVSPGGSDPSTRYSKGPRTMQAIDDNVLWLFEPDAEPTGLVISDRGFPTWILLLRREQNIVRSELSLPKAARERGRIDEWAVRLILEPIDLSAPPAEEPSSPPLDIPITRR